MAWTCTCMQPANKAESISFKIYKKAIVKTACISRKQNYNSVLENVTFIKPYFVSYICIPDFIPNPSKVGILKFKTRNQLTLVPGCGTNLFNIEFSDTFNLKWHLVSQVGWGVWKLILFGCQTVKYEIILFAYTSKTCFFYTNYDVIITWIIWLIF